MKLTNIAAICAALALTGCGETNPSSTALPGGPSGVEAPSRHSLLTQQLSPATTPAGPTLTITSITPNVVSTAGAWGTITGTGFEPSSSLKIGENRVLLVFRDSNTIHFANSGSHPPGAVDVTVFNSNGISITAAHAYTFAEPGSFDVNGEWIAHADAANNYVTDMRFTIQNNTLVSASCGTPVTMPTTLPSHDGQFSFTGDNGLAMTLTMASVTTSYGRIVAPGCGDGRWWADKVP